MIWIRIQTTPYDFPHIVLPRKRDITKHRYVFYVGLASRCIIPSQGRYLMLAIRAVRALIVVSVILSAFASWVIVPSATPLPTLLRPLATESEETTAQAVRALPEDVRVDQEIVARRSAHSATFRVDADTYTTILSPEALHYRDERGVWQPIDPAFRSRGDSFVVEHNSIVSRAGLRRAWLSAAVDQTAVIWEATELGLSDASGNFMLLAEALPESNTLARQRDNDRVLHYADGWNASQIGEEISSAPDSVEHSLVLAAPLSFDTTRPYLELRAKLELLPGATLWADDQPIGKQVNAAETLQVRDASGEIAIVFDRVRAFEQQSPDHDVTGDYVVYATAEADTWIIGVRTPRAWWADEARRYPVVLDPTMRVKRSTGYADGMAWVGSAAGQTTYTAGGIILGPHTFQSGHKLLTDHNTQTRGYVQFNSLPAVLTNTPISITAAYLEVEPLPGSMPAYDDSSVDWEHKALQQNAQLYYVGACPTQAACNTLSLYDNRITNTGAYTWGNSPQGTLVDTKPLKAGPWTSSKPKLVTTTFTVTAQLQDWYHNYFAQTANRPGPLFMLTINNQCPSGGPYEGVWQGGFYMNHSGEIPKCISYDIPAGNMRLRLEYDELPLSLGQQLLNKPGVPSYLEDVFADTQHQYDLTPGTGFPQYTWRAIAVRGNHAFAPGLPTRAGLNLLHATGGVTTTLVSAPTQGPDQTAFIFIDDHNSSGVATADLKAQVTPSNENDYATDLQRNYRIDYEQASPVSLSYGVWFTTTKNMFSDQLIDLTEFSLTAGDSLLIRVSTPLTLSAALVEPTGNAPLADAVIGNNDTRVSRNFLPANNMTRTMVIGYVPTSGAWALALINQGPPIICQPGSDCQPGEADPYYPTISLLVCPLGSIPTAKHGCQPLKLPDNTTPPSRLMPIESGGNLTIYSEGNFVDFSASAWCSISETQGAPVIGPDSAGRYAFVAQGSICRSGGILTTTPDSAIGLTVPVFNFNPGDKRGQFPPTFIYGDTGLSPLPAGLPDGVIRMGGNGELLPGVNTRRNILPFNQYWISATTHISDAIVTADMMLHARDVVNGQVTVEAAQAPLAKQWDVPWMMYPNPAGNVQLYSYVPYPIAQDTPFINPLNLASLELRLSEGGPPDGLVRILDWQRTAGGPVSYQFRATGGLLTQPIDLGGALMTLQVVVQPPGMARLPGNESSCKSGSTPTSCLDLRRLDYDWANGNGEKQVQPWPLPDMHLESGAGTIAFSRPGQLNIFSVDHPAALSGFSQAFSFDTWEANVTVEQAKCVDNGPIVTVIKGKGHIALSAIGDDGSSPPPWIDVEFTLCQTKLRQAQLTFKTIPPGIPVGNTGFGVSLIGGTVTIDPNTDDAEISLDVEFQSLDGTTFTEGAGTVTINTAGLFSLQASGKIVGVVNADSVLLKVAWNPMDVLFNGTVSYKSLLSGNVYLHSWLGQGWQHKYSWLDDDNTFHFTGSIEATLKIPKGEVINKKFFKLPPFGFSLSAEVAFGEFCTSTANCDPKWGMSATVKLFGYKVGVYVDTGGPDLILGSSSHKLIDQFGGALLRTMPHPPAPSPEIKQPISREGERLLPSPENIFSFSGEGPGVRTDAPPPPVFPGNLQTYLLPEFESPANNWPVESPATSCTGTGTSVITCTFAVAAGTGRALWAARWQNGDLSAQLIKPDNTMIDPGNALSHGVIISSTDEVGQHLVTFVATPTIGSTIMSGDWKVQLSNIGVGLLPGITNNFALMFAADPRAPTLNWITPVVTGTTPAGNGLMNLQWSVNRGGQPLEPDVKLDLFYTPFADKPITPTLMNGLIIRTNYSATLNSYQWDTKSLAAGEYAVGARIDDHARGNGHIVVWAPGTIVITDTTPPPVPMIVNTIPVVYGLIVIWQRDTTTPDLAGYQIEYRIPALNANGYITATRRLPPSLEDDDPLYERARLGGLLYNMTTLICVRAYDATGNLSGCNVYGAAMPEGPAPRVGSPTGVVVLVQGTGAVTVTWNSPAGNISGHLFSYRPARCMTSDPKRTANEGPSPFVTGRFNTVALTGLTVGQTYEFMIRPYDDQIDLGPAATVTALLIDPLDANADGLPDQWATLYGITDPAGDADGDGLLNLRELNYGANPLHADSDSDGFYDGEEFVQGTDICGPGRPPVKTTPALALAGNAAMQFTGATNMGPGAPQSLLIFNDGGGTLDWSAEASPPWILLGTQRGADNTWLDINANPFGMTPGIYHGVVTITNQPAALLKPDALLPEQATIKVSLQVLPSQQHELYLPLIRR
jgi:hypothetical protein